MKFLVQITIVLAVLTLVKSLAHYKGNRRCKFPCYFKKSAVCGSDGKTYKNACELLSENCRTRKSIKLIKFGKCPVCALKEPAPRCIVAPCSHPHCPAYPKATCVSFCPCTAEYYHGLHKVNCHPTPTANLCHLKFCGINGVCKVVNGKAVCQSKAPTKNPCHLKFCGIDGICKVVNGKAVCQSKGAVCSSPKLVGPCKARFPRFFFNSKTQQCETFYYGGCRGNKNNFKTKELCEGTCKPKENVCSLPKVVGPCEARTLRYYYNFKTQRCERFFYGGCGGNENNFDTLSQCQKTCARKVGDVCSLPKVAGPCKGSITRYYHNSKTRRCERFFYGGCGGNKNNFDTLSQCQRTCARKDPCASISCKAGMECKVILRRAMCRPILANPCIAILCLAGRKCVVVNGEGRCIPSKPSCAAVLCLKGKKCVIINGRPTCATPCSSHPDCKQQGSFCSNLGVCECSRLCPAIHQPVCDSDGRRYSNRCQLDIAACRKKTTITSVTCPGDVKSTQ